jgi:ribosome-binding factor A
VHPRRLVRLNELVQQTVSQAVLNLKDPGLGFVTITGADIAPDLSFVKIYYSVLGSKEERSTTAEALERAKSHLRRDLGQLENLRKVPQITFVYDESLERADRVYKLLDTIQHEIKPDEPVNGA